jgi:tRNA (guanine-N7-)-methyltransferase
VSDDASPESDKKHRPIRSFVRREGRMTVGQQTALDDLLPCYGLDPAQPLDIPTCFGRVAPLVFEIGFGVGDYLLARATAQPQNDFIGVEVHRPGVGHLLSRVHAAGLTNVRVYTTDAVEVLDRCIADAALDEIVIQFPDPWHKKRHNKRRLVQPSLATRAVRNLKPGGRLLLATDWAEYAVQMVEVLNAEPALRNLSPTNDYVPKPPERILTRFEKRGERLGHSVFDLAYERIADTHTKQS